MAPVSAGGPRPSLPVTVVVPVRNEEKNIAECLTRLRGFAGVLVVDSGSTDRTCDIAREHGARVITFEWDGRFPKKRNWVLRTQAIETPWVLFLDADEGRFMNHADQPNTDFRGADFGIALRDIPAGEELTCDYREFTFGELHMQPSRHRVAALAAE